MDEGGGHVLVQGGHSRPVIAGGKELLEFEHPRITRLPYRLAGRFRVLGRALVLSALAPLSSKPFLDVANRQSFRNDLSGQ